MKVPDVTEPPDVLFEVVGLGRVDQQTPVDVTATPPVEEIVPPLMAPVPVIDVAAVVFSTARPAKLVKEV